MERERQREQQIDMYMYIIYTIYIYIERERERERVRQACSNSQASDVKRSLFWMDFAFCLPRFAFLIRKMSANNKAGVRIRSLWVLGRAAPAHSSLCRKPPRQASPPLLAPSLSESSFQALREDSKGPRPVSQPPATCLSRSEVSKVPSTSS